MRAYSGCGAELHLTSRVRIVVQPSHEIVIVLPVFTAAASLGTKGIFDNILTTGCKTSERTSDSTSMVALVSSHAEHVSTYRGNILP